MKVRCQVFVTLQQRVPLRIYFKSRNLTFICNSSDLIDRLSIIRGLRSALAFRTIGSRIRRSSVFSLATLTVVTILVFGIPVVGVFYTSRLT